MTCHVIAYNIIYNDEFMTCHVIAYNNIYNDEFMTCHVIAYNIIYNDEFIPCYKFYITLIFKKLFMNWSLSSIVFENAPFIVKVLYFWLAIIYFTTCAPSL